MTLRYPDDLPTPQVASQGWQGPFMTLLIDVLAGPTRVRLSNRNATAVYQFEAWYSAAQMAQFEAWYDEVVAAHDGEFYAPWVGGGRVLAFATEYDQAPFGTGWKISGLMVQTRLDPSLCDDHIVEVFGNIYRDDGVSPTIYQADIASANRYQDKFDLDLIAENPC